MSFAEKIDSLMKIPLTSYQTSRIFGLLHADNLDESEDHEIESTFNPILEEMRKNVDFYEKGNCLSEGEAYKMMRNALILPCDTTGDRYNDMSDSSLKFYELLLNLLHTNNATTQKKIEQDATEEIQ